MKRYALFGPMVLALYLAPLFQLYAVTNETPQEKADRLAWWREGRFGMFIHWGPVSIVGTEISWSRGGERRGIGGKGEIPVEVYDNLYKKFNPVKFNAEEWVSIARSAGMKYMVLTAKHCDGFCLWRSKVDDYNIGNTPFHRDVCKELATAAHRNEMRLGWYYSPMDWRDPDCRTERNGIYVKKMQGHLRELLSNYGRIDLLWFDAEGGSTPWDQENTYRLVRTLQPRMIINDRLGLGPYAERSPEHIDPYADYQTPEQRVGAFEIRRPWETCMTLGTQWSWKPNDKIKTFDECVRILVQCVTGDGNLLLNVGPMPTGEIEPRQAKVLKEIGGWLKKYGESVYGTRGGPYRNGTWGGATRKGKTVYLHIARWDDDSGLRLPALPAKIRKCSVLTGGKVKMEQKTDGVLLTMPPSHRRKFDTIVKLVLDRPANNLEPIEVREVQSSEIGTASVQLTSPPDSQYAANGVSSLVDGRRGTTDRLDGRWLGFEGKDFEAVLDLHAIREISRVAVGCLQAQVSTIFFPKKVEISVSKDGSEYTSAGTIDTGEPKEEAEIRSNDFAISCMPVPARFIRVRVVNIGTCPKWHPGAGGKAWLFVDEIIVK